MSKPGTLIPELEAAIEKGTALDFLNAHQKDALDNKILDEFTLKLEENAEVTPSFEDSPLKVDTVSPKDLVSLSDGAKEHAYMIIVPDPTKYKENELPKEFWIKFGDHSEPFGSYSRYNTDNPSFYYMNIQVAYLSEPAIDSKAVGLGKFLEQSVLRKPTQNEQGLIRKQTEWRTAQDPNIKHALWTMAKNWPGIFPNQPTNTNFFQVGSAKSKMRDYVKPVYYLDTKRGAGFGGAGFHSRSDATSFFKFMINQTMKTKVLKAVL